VERSGDFKVIDIPDKIFIDRLFEFRRYDKNTVFGVVYSEKKTGRAFFKRTRIAQFIKDREYRIAPEGCRLELITPRPNAIYEIKVDTPIKAKQVQQISLMDAPERSPKAGGILISPRKLLKITFVRLLDESDAAPEPELVEVPPDDDGGNGGNGGNGAGNGNIPASEETKPASANPPELSPVEPAQPVDAAPQMESVPEAKPVKRRVLPKKDAGSVAAPASFEAKKASEPKPPVEAKKASEPRSPVEVKKAPEPKPPVEAKKASEPRPPVEAKKAPEAKPVVKPVPTAKPAPQTLVKPAPQTQPDADVKSQVSAAEPEKKPEPPAPAPENKTDSSKRSVDTEREEDSWDVQPDLGF
jgi:topoisomerase-4 subunit A